MSGVGVAVLAVAVATGGDCSKQLERLIRAHSATLLTEYRVPSPKDVTGLWAAYSSARGVCPYLATGDFNKDGRSDQAFILPGRRSGFGVFVLLSLTKGYALQTLERSNAGAASSRGMVYLCPVMPDLSSAASLPERGRDRLCVGGESPKSYDYDDASGELRPTPKYVW